MNKEINFDEMDDLGMDKRESVRLAKKLSARIQNQTCDVLNISKKGVLLETVMPVYLFPVSNTIHFELEIEGQWISIDGIIKWVVCDQVNSRVGVFIKRAPELYLNYLKQIYS
jgi:hypothetical protein